MGRCYPHLNLDKRRKLAKWLEAKIPVKEIADNLARAPSTIYREIKRNYYRDDELPQLNGYGLSDAKGAALAALEYARCQLLRRGVERGHRKIRQARDHEQRPRITVHRDGLDHHPDRCRDQNLNASR